MILLEIAEKTAETDAFVIFLYYFVRCYFDFGSVSEQEQIL